jgi:hypothetical protein
MNTEERIETDPVSGSAWTVREGMSWAKDGIFALVKGHQLREVALGYVLATQPFVGRMYGGLSTAWASGVWDPDHQTYVKFATLRLLHEYEFDANVLEAQFLQQPFFVEVKSGTAFAVHTHEVVSKVRHYRDLL